MRWRDLAWTLRGRAYRNPPLPPEVLSILFVCTANLCRSPFAAAAATKLLGEDPRIAVASAGLHATPGRSAPLTALACAAERGIDLQGHRTAGVTAERLDQADLIVAMEPRHVSQLRRDWEPQVPICLLSLFDVDAAVRPAFERYHIADPVGGDLETFHRCFARIETSVRALILGLSAPVRL